MSNEAKLLADIEAIKAGSLDTQSLYREVCTIMFFRYGITPTANKLYQYVHKGSMSAPAEALAKFWVDLREKSRVRIEHPDLPDPLKGAAGELLAELWNQARKFSDEALSGFREELMLKLAKAQHEREQAEQAQLAAEQASAWAQGQIRQLEEGALELERKLAAADAKGESLKQQLENAKQQRIGCEAALVEARRDYSNELEKSRQELRHAEDRLAASERRALLEIDRERQSAIKSQKELAQIRQSSQDLAERQRAEMAGTQRELAASKQLLGVAEGALAEMRASHELQLREAELLRQAQAADKTRIALLENELSRLHSQLKTPRERQMPQSIPVKKLRRNRKIAT